MRNIFFSVCVALLFHSCKSQQILPSYNKHMYDIIFANGFFNDTIALLLDENEIFNSVVLTSDKSDGITNLRITINKKDNDYIISSSLIKVQHTYSVNKDDFEFKVYYNSFWHRFVPKEGMGEYIIIDSKSSDLKFTQQIKEPIFD
ncbi:MAG: hypothetical protein WAT21_08210 [Saprospiraceae bacterium]